MAIKVIGTGLGRTGTHSLKMALEQLGFGKCYHMVELLNNPAGLRHFEEAERGEDTNWDALFQGYLSAVDYPVARYYKPLLTKYPDAKVVHTTRDPEAWYESCRNTIFWASKPDAGRILKMMIRMPFSSTIRKRLPVLKYNGRLIDLEFGNDLNNKAEIIKRFKQRDEEIERTVPKERLLKFNVKEGWEPLCRFLGVAVPSTSFPKSNSTEEFIHNVKSM
jgi:hypothetical protein